MYHIINNNIVNIIL